FLRQTRHGRDVYRDIVAFDREGRYVAGSRGADVVAPAGSASSFVELHVVPRGPGASATLALATPVFNPRRQGERIGTLVAVVDPERLLRAVTTGARDRSATVMLRDASRVLATAHPVSAGASKTRSDVPQATFEKIAALGDLAGVKGPVLTVLV